MHTFAVMAGWLLNLAYLLALVLASPVWLVRMLRHGKYRRDWAQRLGRVRPRHGLQPMIWIHGVSVGEIRAARQLVAEIHSQLPDFRVAVSATTDTGLQTARDLFAPDHVVFRYPADFTFAVSAALGRLRPALVVLIEGDVWPNFLAACRRRDIPVVVVNGRVGPRKGYPRYRRIRPFAARMFNALTAIGVQDQVYADLFGRLGVDAGKLTVTGMMKYDTARIADRVDGQDALARALGIDPEAPLLVAGGTGAGEEAIVLDAFETVRRAGGAERVRLAIIPRKPERFEQVARLIAERGHRLVRRGEHPDGDTPAADAEAVILGDTMGDLGKFYALATCVFVGRSLVPQGGSDMIEAAALGRPVAFGPHTFNFPQADALVAAGAACRVADADELAAVWAGWLSDPAGATRIAKAAREF
ncbi:MAG: 3-deoxy-D-manno-octulosonic acid transferase, partial [Planctomycetota bacterium]